MIESYSALPVGKYEEIIRISRDTALEEVDRQARILAVLTGLSADDILHLPIQDYKGLVRRSRFLESEALGDPGNIRTAIARTYKLRDFTLVPVTDFRKLTVAQYVDFQTFAK